MTTTTINGIRSNWKLDAAFCGVTALTYGNLDKVRPMSVLFTNGNEYSTSIHSVGSTVVYQLTLLSDSYKAVATLNVKQYASLHQWAVTAHLDGLDYANLDGTLVPLSNGAPLLDVPL